MVFLKDTGNIVGMMVQCIKEILSKGQETDMESGKEVRTTNKFIKVII